MYCCNCRQPPCTKSCCPFGHSFEKRTESVDESICDVCHGPAKLMSKKGVRVCMECDFDICGMCYDEIEKSGSVPV